MASTLNLLLVEDSPSDARVIEAYVIEGLLGTVTVEREKTLESAMARLSKGDIDATLLDLGLPDSSGLDTFRRISRTAPRTPVIIVSGLDDTHLAQEAVTLGAQDYVVKDGVTPKDLARAVTYAIARQRVLDDLERGRHAQLEAKDRFLSHVSHELRTPLAAVYAFVSLVADETVGPLESEQRDCLAVATRNIQQLTRMIDDLLNVGRVAANGVAFRAERVCVSELVDQCVFAFRPRAREKGIEVSIETTALPDAWCDSGRTAQVLNNLLDNALKFTPAGGSIVVRQCRLSNAIQVTVEDSGRGVRPGNHDRIFEQFFQEEDDDDRGSRAGLGLGLFICRELVEGQGGRIWVENRPLTLGSSFTFTLPARATRTAEETK
jgi:two-component system sensor histidine kinase/response regulator